LKSIILAAGLILEVTTFAPTASAADDLTLSPIPEDTLWRNGFLFWSGIYYLSGVLVIALPTIVASDLISSARSKSIMSVLTAIVGGFITFAQPGAKATAYEHANLCWQNVRMTSSTSDAARQGFRKCQTFIDYEYQDTQRKPGGAEGR
jgi:hypothetical protein